MARVAYGDGCGGREEGGTEFHGMGGVKEMDGGMRGWLGRRKAGNCIATCDGRDWWGLASLGRLALTVGICLTRARYARCVCLLRPNNAGCSTHTIQPVSLLGPVPVLSFSPIPISTPFDLL